MSQTMDLPAIGGHMFAFTVAASSKEKVKSLNGSLQRAGATERQDAHAWQLQWNSARPDDIVLSATLNSRSITAAIEQRVSPHAHASLSCTASLSGVPSSLVMRLDRALPGNCACSIGLALPSSLQPEARWAFTARALSGQQNDKEKDKDKDKDAGQPATTEHRVILSAKAHLSAVTLGASASAKFKATPTDHFSLGLQADVTDEHVVSGFVALKTNFGKRTQAGLKISVNAGGVVLTPWFSRLKQKLHLPLSLVFAPTLASSLLFTAGPLLLSSLILRFIELPRRARIDAQVSTPTPSLSHPTPNVQLQAKATARDETAAATEAKRQEAHSCVRSPSPLYFYFLIHWQVRGADPAPGRAAAGAGGRAERPRYREGCVRAFSLSLAVSLLFLYELRN